MEKQKVVMYIQLTDTVPYGDNYLNPNKVYHWRIYINNIESNSYWVVCAKNPLDAIFRFIKFSIYEPEVVYMF